MLGVRLALGLSKAAVYKRTQLLCRLSRDQLLEEVCSYTIWHVISLCCALL